MRIGIIGSGNMGQALGGRWAAAGHAVLFGSRDSAKAIAIAERCGHSAQAGSFDDAAAFGEVVLHTVRGVFPSELLAAPGSLDGKIVIDCNNSDLPADFRFAIPVPSLAERLARDVARARVVKAFNTMAAELISLDLKYLAPQRVSDFVCSDDRTAKAVVAGLAAQIGFEPVDSGSLEHTYLLEALGDFIRLQIAGLGRGPMTAISVHQVMDHAAWI